MRVPRRFIYSLVALLSLLIALGSGLLTGKTDSPAIAQPAPLSIPLTTYRGAPVLDPTQFTFASLPPFATRGSLQAPGSAIAALGYDPSITWNAGDRPADILKLGTFRDVFALERFNLQAIGQLMGLELSKLSLQSFELMSWQSVTTLVAAIPGLQDLQVSQVPPIADLAGSAYWGSTIGNLVRQAPQLAQQTLGDRLKLEHYALDSIPGLAQTPVGNFFQAGHSRISGVPGLDLVPSSQFPIPLQIQPGAIVARMDLPLHTAEGQRTNTQPISGSDRAGFRVPCNQFCSHFETAEGWQWFAGDQQQVPGGEGVLGQAFGGKEPTGRLPYGPAFKVVVAHVNEAAGTIETQLFFRLCSRGWIDLGCTPYSIGPLPFLPYRESDLIFLGVQQPGPIAAESSTPTQFISPSISPQTPSGPDPGRTVPLPEANHTAGSIDPTFGFVQP
ncbi:hypothetical protein BST81_12820 [Leptolyngbya sp. 'hensonii']|uniref:hypothetical protein n=1 Tax=Leptolyngbya sp. 'hensonii' TaxID=1922337 RepID=UPI00094FC1CA|nr:hypothetical protein [Leptolyngbya sp. 'hensonii']OLP17933.1 hypothetical protein BST81_12820 [Leptolyngbya sp. 'hensonii']